MALIEGSLEVKLPTIWTDEKQRWEESEKRREEKKREDQRKERVRRKKMQVHEKVGKSRNTVFFPMICGSGGSKSRLAKAAGAEPCGQMRNWNCTPLWREEQVEVKMYKAHTRFGALLEREMSKKCMLLWREAHLQVKKIKTLHIRSTFGSWDVEKSARCCGGKHILKSKCTKHTMLGPLLEVEMFKKCTPLREAHFEVSVYKTRHVRATFGRSDFVSRGWRKGLWT